jgi:hypothetical protein
LELRYKGFTYRTSYSAVNTSRFSRRHPPTTSFAFATTYFGDSWGGDASARYLRGFYSSEPPIDNPSLTVKSVNASLYLPISKRLWLHKLLQDGDSAKEINGVYYLFGAGYQRLTTAQPLLDSSDNVSAFKLYKLRHLEMRDVLLGLGAKATVFTDELCVVACGVRYYSKTHVSLGVGLQQRDSNVDFSRYGILAKAALGLDLGVIRQRYDGGIGVLGRIIAPDFSDEGMFFLEASLRAYFRLHL